MSFGVDVVVQSELLNLNFSRKVSACGLVDRIVMRCCMLDHSHGWPKTHLVLMGVVVLELRFCVSHVALGMSIVKSYVKSLYYSKRRNLSMRIMHVTA